MKTKFYIVRNSLLGYVTPAAPMLFQILSASVLRGATEDWMSGPLMFRFFPPEDIRPATLQDFEDFRVRTEPYLKDKVHYEMPTA